jgi:Uma2 family endonuclease
VLPIRAGAMPTAANKRWTYADYCRIPADRNRHEIVDGVHYVSPAPTPLHQTVVTRLIHQMMLAIEDPGLGRVLTAPIDVHLGRGSCVQPDLVVVRNRNLRIIGDKKLRGAPDLLVEIRSPRTASYDRRIKLPRYARAGVREVWLVDPELRVVEQFETVDRRCVLVGTHDERVRLRVLPRVAIALGRVF